MVRNGSLCSGGDQRKIGFDAIADWSRTPIVLNKSDRKVTMKFLGTAPHTPSFWKVYITKDGFDTTK